MSSSGRPVRLAQTEAPRNAATLRGRMTSQRRPQRESALRRVAPMAACGLVIALAAGTLFVTGATLGNLVMGEPAAAASIQPSEPAAAVGSGRATDAQPSAGASPSAGPSSAPPASPSPFATPKPGPFAMDLYRRGD